MNFPRILCVSANPAIDRRLRFDSISLGRINRAISAENLPGGKAAHVAMTAQALHARPLWLGFLGGSVGEEFVAEFRKLQIELVAIRTSRRTRMNLELLESSGKITEILEPGETPRSAELLRMVRSLGTGLQRKWRGAVVVISGSLPGGVFSGFYGRLISAARSAGARAFLDTSGKALRAALAARPALIKPNLEEAEAFLGHSLKNQVAIVGAARTFIERGAESAAISFGAKGLIWAESKNGPVWIARPPALKSISTVGCGDATMAGFAIAAARGRAGEGAVRLATACGVANCLAKFPGRVSASVVKSLIPQIEVRRIE